MKEIKIRHSELSDHDRILEIVNQSGLATKDLNWDKLDFFFVAEVEGKICGVIGLEPFEHCGLLRSLAVSVEYRGHNIGTKLLKAVEEAAQHLKISRLYLTTNDHEGFFHSHHYTEIDRGSVPMEIMYTTELQDSGSIYAVTMVKEL